MKHKVFCLLLVIVLVLSACMPMNTESDTRLGDEQPDKGQPEEVIDVLYTKLSADWPVYQTANELVNHGDIIVLGTITGISFKILDARTNEPPESNSDGTMCHLNTIYNVDVLTSYKNCDTETLQFCMMGGVEGAYVKEQVAALGAQASAGIPLMEDMPKLEVGKVYLFVLHQYEDYMPTLVNVDQSAFEAKAPTKKDRYDCVSLKEVLMSFGTDAWQGFEEGEYTK